MISPNKEAEQAVIGAIIMSPETVLPEAVLQIGLEDFQIVEYRNVYAACKALYDLNKPVDVLTVLGRLDEAYKPLIAEACAAAPTVKNFQSYIGLVKSSARRIRAYREAQSLEAALLEGEELDECRTLAVRANEALNETDAKTELSAKDLFLRFCETKMKPKTYIKTGISRLDRLTYIDRGDYVIVGARPSAGKTALTLQLMLTMARTMNVVYFSLETSGMKLMDRIVANFTSTPLSSIKEGTVTDWSRIAEAYDRFKNLRLFVVEAAGWTVAQIRAKAVQLRADVIFIDYLSLIKSEGKGLYERVTNISMDLHTMAQQSKITVVALSQLNREGKGEPDMTSLRESGQIEQDADVILLLHETDREQQNSDRKLIIAKNKEGSTGYITLSFTGEFQRFCEYETRYEE